MSRFPAIAAALTLLPLTAQAHQGDHSHVAPTHGLTSVDHLSALVLFGVVVALLAFVWARR